MTKTASVVVHTHWDREWYFTNETYTARLARIFPSIIDGLETNQINKFLFDGQVAALEDLLENCEECIAEAVILYIGEGRINIGPWYVMPDEFLCSGESLIRNLEEGIRIAQKYGESSFIGYLPDTFGHIAQMPQIFNGFEIDTAVVWRGIDIDDDVFQWRSPNGESVNCIFLREGYYQHPFSKVAYVEAVTRHLDALAEAGDREPLLLTQGGDHLAPPGNLQDRIEHFNSAQGKYRIKPATFREYVAERLAGGAQPHPALTGELRENTNAFVLPDVLSTRRYLKRLNQKAEDRLCGQIEPLLAAADLKDSYPHKYLRKTWKLLLQQHAHDSICGCSIDEVHQEMIVRFRRIQDRLDALEALVCEQLGFSSAFANQPGAPSPFADDSLMTAFNPSVKPRSGWHRALIFLAGEKAAEIKVEDHAGRSLETVLCHCEADSSFVSPVDDFPDRTVGHRYEILVRLNLGGWESSVLRFSKKDRAGASPQAPPSSSEKKAAATIANDWLSISLLAEGIRIENIRCGDFVEAAFSIVSEGDAGDTYNYSPPATPWLARAEITGARTRALQSKGAELELEFRLPQPASLNADRSGASENEVTSHGLLRIRLLNGEPFARASLKWMNRAKDHRLRLLAPLGEKIAKTVSDSAFSLIERPVVYQERQASPPTSEARVSVNPSHSLVQAGKFSIVHRAMQEYEILEQAGMDVLALTLIRSVGWLSRRDLITRSAGAGPDLETPEAQCIGEDEFQFLFSVGKRAENRLSLDVAEAFRRPVLFLKGGGAVTQRPLELDARELLVSSCRQVDEGVEIRLFNPTGDKQSYDLSGGSPKRVSLAGAELQDQSNTVAPDDIATLRILR